MTECEIDSKIKNYWACKEKLIPEDILHRMEELCKEFQDATEDNPVNAAEFLMHLDLSSLEDFLKGLYKREPIYPAESMLKALFLMDLKGMKFYTELKRHLRNNCREAEMLGFPRKNGHVLVPSDKSFWHFDRIRIGLKWDALFSLLRNSTVKEARSLGISMGEKTAEDATPIEALPGDEEAEYNDYYKVSGYKMDTVTDLETDVPLSKKVTGINADEARNLIPHLDGLMKACGKVRDHWMDGGYSDYNNLAWMGVHRIRGHYPINENWVLNDVGDAANLMRLYQSYWKDCEFKSNADISFVLSFLLERGHVEEVGSFFRNNAMDRYVEDPLAYLKDYHRRSRQEGNHGYWKEHLGIESRLRVKGLVKVDCYLTRNLCSILAVALCRLQHGLKEKLTSIVYLT